MEDIVHSATRSYFSDFRQWHHVIELLLTVNALAISLAIAQVEHLSDLSWISVLHHVIFVSWIAIVFAVSVTALQRQLSRLQRRAALLVSFLLLFAIIFFSDVLLSFLRYWVSDVNLQTQLSLALHHAVLGGLVGGICLRYLYMREQAIEREQAELQARVQALQARIHPHFLFNSLNSVVSLIDRDPFKAEQLLIDLSQLFRASLTELKEVTLEQEIQLCQRYLQIEKVRLGERLQIKWRIEGEAYLTTAKIPLLTLQPLLENCIYHGVESFQQLSLISLFIEVDPHRVTIVLTNPYQEHAREGNGIAMQNIRQRLAVYYRDSVEFKTFANHGLFTTLLSYRY